MVVVGSGRTGGGCTGRSNSIGESEGLLCLRFRFFFFFLSLYLSGSFFPGRDEDEGAREGIR